MNEKQTTSNKPTETSEPKPGFFKRVFTKLDQSMKEQADAKAKNSCCSGDNNKGGKCC
jgi:hypothetical protein